MATEFEAAVLRSVYDYESMQETIDVLADSELTATMRGRAR